MGGLIAIQIQMPLEAGFSLRYDLGNEFANQIRVVDMVRIEPERVKKKNAAAIYRYQADCDGAWGEIYFDFEKKRIRIKRLAEWDTTKSHIYAWKVICFIALSGELPKEKRIVFERE